MNSDLDLSSSSASSQWFHGQSAHKKGKRGLFVIPVVYLWAIMTTLALVMGWESYQVLRQYRKAHNYFSVEAANQLIDFYVWTLIAIGIWQLMRFLPVQGPNWKRQLFAHIGISLLVSPLATFAYIGVLAPTGLGRGDMSIAQRLQWNLHSEWIPNAMEYLTILAILVSAEYYRRFREDQEEKQRLNRALTEAKLHALRAQLNPHFLFNALNSVSCLVYNQPAAADQMLSNIANLLRLTLARDDSKEVRLLEEVEIAEEYLEIQKIRFGPRLKMEIDIADEVLDALVPNMLLQPLVENACVHGAARTRGECRLEINANAEAAHLVISIYNDGPPTSRDWKTHPGIGLRNTLERLRLLYGANSDLELVNAGSGVRMTLRLPLLLERDRSDPNELPVASSTSIVPAAQI